MSSSSVILLMLYVSKLDAFYPSRILTHQSPFLRLSDIPSDYESEDLVIEEKVMTVDEKEEDEQIRNDLKKELIMIACVTNRGSCATKDERTLIEDLVTQLEAMNPTKDPLEKCYGEWDLCYSSTQLWRASPFFMSVRSWLGDVSLTMFDIHSRATTAGMKILFFFFNITKCRARNIMHNPNQPFYS